MKSRRTRWILGILAVVLVAVGFAVFNSYRQNERERKHVEYAEKLGCTVFHKHLFQLGDSFFIPLGTVDTIWFPAGRKATVAEMERLLGYFPDLEHLDLSGTLITDEIMEPISSHSKLRSINLLGTSVTDEGVKSLSKCSSLTSVSLDSTEISDDSIAHLSMMSQLKYLKISFTPVTDKSVDILSKMPKLVYLNVSGTQISKEGKSRLSKIKDLVD